MGIQLGEGFDFCVAASAGIDEAYRIKGLLPEQWSDHTKIRVDQLTHINHRIVASIGDEEHEFTEIQPLYDRPIAAHSGVNAAIVLARLGCKVTLVCAVGQDTHGTLLKDQLKEKLISECVYLRRESTPYSFLLVDDYNRRILLVRKDPYDIDVEEVRRKCSALLPSRVILMGLHSYEIPLALILGEHKAKFDHVVPSRDFYTQLDTKQVEEFCKKIHTLQVNQSEALEMFGTPNIHHQLKELHGLGADTAIVTSGRKGVHLSNGSFVHREKAFPIGKEVDTTGCGDTLAATFSALTLTFPLTASLQAAVWAAALCARYLGANGGSPKWTQIHSYILQRHYNLSKQNKPAAVLS